MNDYDPKSPATQFGWAGIFVFGFLIMFTSVGGEFFGTFFLLWLASVGATLYGAMR